MEIHFECKLNPENVILNVDFCKRPIQTSLIRLLGTVT